MKTKKYELHIGDYVTGRGISTPSYGSQFDFNRSNPRLFSSNLRPGDITSFGAMGNGIRNIGGINKLVELFAFPISEDIKGYFYGDLRGKMLNELSSTRSDTFPGGDIRSFTLQVHKDQNGRLYLFSTTGSYIHPPNDSPIYEDRILWEGRGVSQGRYDKMVERMEEAIREYNLQRDMEDFIRNAKEWATRPWANDPRSWTNEGGLRGGGGGADGGRGRSRGGGYGGNSGGNAPYSGTYAGPDHTSGSGMTPGSGGGGGAGRNPRPTALV